MNIGSFVADSFGRKKGKMQTYGQDPKTSKPKLESYNENGWVENLCNTSKAFRLDKIIRN